MNHLNLILPENLASQRLDKALAKLLPEYSRTQIQKLIINGLVFINKSIITSVTYQVQTGDNIFIKLIETKISSEIVPKKIDFEIIYEDEDLIVINKPAGLTVHPGTGNQDSTLVNALLYYTQNLSNVNNDVQRPGIVHRLDKDTTGAMVVAKTNQAHFNLSDQIESRQLKREYKALVWGRINPLSGSINLNITRDKNFRLKMTVTKNNGKKALTHYNTEGIFQEGLMSLINCKLDTGRTHQIRVHMSHIGHSIIGDQIYGKSKKKTKKVFRELGYVIENFTRQALHSHFIAFHHPRSNKLMEFYASMPNDFIKLIELLQKKIKFDYS